MFDPGQLAVHLMKGLLTYTTDHWIRSLQSCTELENCFTTMLSYYICSNFRFQHKPNFAVQFIRPPLTDPEHCFQHYKTNYDRKLKVDVILCSTGVNGCIYLHLLLGNASYSSSIPNIAIVVHRTNWTAHSIRRQCYCALSSYSGNASTHHGHIIRSNTIHCISVHLIGMLHDAYFND